MNKPIVKVVDRKKEIEHTTDESELVVSAILSLNGHSFTCLFRKLTSAEANHSDTGKEALAIV